MSVGLDRPIRSLNKPIDGKQTAAARLINGLPPRMNRELAVNMFDMRLNGTNRKP